MPLITLVAPLTPTQKCVNSILSKRVQMTTFQKKKKIGHHCEKKSYMAEAQAELVSQNDLVFQSDPF